MDHAVTFQDSIGLPNTDDPLLCEKVTPTTTIIAKGDSAVFNHYFPPKKIASLQDIVADKFGPTIVLPNISTLAKHSTAKLPFTLSISYPAKKISELDNKQHSLISLGQLCEDNCQSMLDKNNLYDFNNEKLFFQGNRSHSGIILWSIHITSHNKSTALKSPAEAAATKQTH